MRRLWYVVAMRHVSLAAAATCAFVVASALVARARARAEQPIYDAIALEVAVGETVTRSVGFALGLRCDDLAIARAELRAGTPEANVFSVTGVTPGATTCRVGTTPNRPTYLYEIRVVPKR
ncbi:MAG TPA: hypothetical protein VFP84_06955 [Kofleriaceae bacterium]|nr:hypothetical protein [Kofleriaceae bacterium]